MFFASCAVTQKSHSRINARGFMVSTGPYFSLFELRTLCSREYYSNDEVKLNIDVPNLRMEILFTTIHMCFPSTRRTSLYGDNSFRGKLFFGNTFSHNCIVCLLIEGIRHTVFHKVSG